MLNGPEHASKCNIDESAWGITGQVFIIKFQFLSRILWFGHQWCYTPRPVICHCITLQTSGSWVNAPKHVAYALLILCYKGHSFSPHRMSKSLFLTRCHWEGSLSHSLSLSDTSTVSLFPFCHIEFSVSHPSEVELSRSLPWMDRTGQSGTTGIITSLFSHTAGFRYNSILFLYSPLPPTFLYDILCMFIFHYFIYFKQREIANVEYLSICTQTYIFNWPSIDLIHLIKTKNKCLFTPAGITEHFYSKVPAAYLLQL